MYSIKAKDKAMAANVKFNVEFLNKTDMYGKCRQMQQLTRRKDIRRKYTFDTCTFVNIAQ